jgi:hypothetical protein
MSLMTRPLRIFYRISIFKDFDQLHDLADIPKRIC